MGMMSPVHSYEREELINYIIYLEKISKESSFSISSYLKQIKKLTYNAFDTVQLRTYRQVINQIWIEIPNEIRLNKDQSLEENVKNYFIAYEDVVLSYLKSVDFLN